MKLKPKRLALVTLVCGAMLLVSFAGLHSEQINLKNPQGDVDLTDGVFLALKDTLFPIGEALPDHWPAHQTHAPGASSTEERYPITLRNVSSNIIVRGGTVRGMMDPRAPWHVWKGYSDGAGLRFAGKGTVEVRDMSISNVEDGIDPRAAFNIHDVMIDRVHDDIIENDAVFSGVITNSFLRGHTFLSARGNGNNPSAIVTVKNCVIELMLQPHQGQSDYNDINKRGGYPFPDGLGNGSVFKWNGRASGKVKMSDTVILMHRPPTSSNAAAAFPAGEYARVTLVWLGQGDYPAPVPQGVTITRDRTAYDRAVDAFFASHPRFGRDGSITSTNP